MMDCTQYRRSILADPRQIDAPMRSHLSSCDACTRYTERLLRFEDRLERALRVAADTSEPRLEPLQAPWSNAITEEQPARGRRGWFAVAAALLLAALLGSSLWLASPRRSLAADVVGHMGGEPGAWERTDVAVPRTAMEHVLGASHIRLRANAGLVTYANSCLFRGHLVPHLVVQTEAGPVTVMVLTHESVAHLVRIDEQGYRGAIVPSMGHGSLAVIERGAQADSSTLEAVAAQVRAAIDYID